MTEAAAHADHFASARQQRAAGELGIWVFLVTEVLFFGALFVAYAVYRHAYPAAFQAAGREANVVYGTVNSVILLTSSLTASVAVRLGHGRECRAASLALAATIVLAFAFLVVKGFEYWSDFSEHLFPGDDFKLKISHTEIFWCFYWIATAIHGIHILIGTCVLAVVAMLVRHGAFDPATNATLDVAVLYWHFVDMVWIFLYPTLYLVGRA